jgi:three-Cys-motif partner protein
VIRKAEAEAYEPDEDGLPRELVGAWVEKKHAHLTGYVGRARAARQKFLGTGKAGATYIDLFCGPGRARVRDTQNIVDGSAVAAWKETLAYGARFSAVHIADRNPRLLEACHARLSRLGAPVRSHGGEATDVIEEIVGSLNPHALHLGFLDPYNLESLDFSLIEKLSRFRRMDLIVHLSAGEGSRNIADYVDKESPQIASFAPGWQKYVDRKRGKQSLTQQLFQYWLTRVQDLGFRMSESVVEVRNEKSALMYWLVHLSKHELPKKLWTDASDDGQGKLF